MEGHPVIAARYLKEGFDLMRQPGVRGFVIVPLILNVLAYVLIMGFALQQFSLQLSNFIAAIPDWMSFLNFIIWPIFVIFLLVFIAYTFTILANLISAPFNCFLAEKAEKMLSGSDYQEQETALKDIPNIIKQSLKREVAKLIHYLPWLLLVWIIGLIPGINVIAPVLWLVFGAWMMAVQYVDYPMDQNQIEFSELKRLLRQHGFSSMGFGGATLVASMIPLLNLLVIPAAICGATIFWVREIKPGYHETEVSTLQSSEV